MILGRLTATTLLAGLFPVLGTSPSPAHAQTPSAVAAEAVARAAISAMEEARWEAVADLAHPMAIEQAHEAAVEEARRMEEHLSDTEFRPDYSEMPEAVAEWFEEQTGQSMGDYGSPMKRLYGVETVAELEALSPREFFSRWVRAHDPVFQMQASMPEEQQAMLDLPARARSLRGNREVVGSVLESDTVAHVVYRDRGGLRPAGWEGPGVLTLRRVDDRWAVWPTSSGTGLFGPPSFMIESIDAPDRAAVAERVVTWPDGEPPVGRAYVVGYTSEEEPPRGLAFEATSAEGETVRVEVPVSAFAELIEMMQYWSFMEPPER